MEKNMHYQRRHKNINNDVDAISTEIQTWLQKCFESGNYLSMDKQLVFTDDGYKFYSIGIHRANEYIKKYYIDIDIDPDSLQPVIQPNRIYFKRIKFTDPVSKVDVLQQCKGPVLRLFLADFEQTGGRTVAELKSKVYIITDFIVGGCIIENVVMTDQNEPPNKYAKHCRYCREPSSKHICFVRIKQIWEEKHEQLKRKYTFL